MVIEMKMLKPHRQISRRGFNWIEEIGVLARNATGLLTVLHQTKPGPGLWIAAPSLRLTLQPL